MSSREKIGLSRRGAGGQSKKGLGSSSIRSSRQNLGRSIRGTASSNSTGRENNAASVANASRILIDGVDMTPRSLLFPNEYEPMIISGGGGGAGHSISSSKIGSQSRSNLSAKSRSNLRSSVASNASGHHDNGGGGGGGGGGKNAQKTRGLTNTNKGKTLEMDSATGSGDGGKSTASSGEGKMNAKVTAAAQTQATSQVTAAIAEQKESMTGAEDVLTNKKQEPKLTNRELNAMVELTLTETRTETVLYIVGICVGTDSPECRVVTEQNTAYENMVEARSSHADLYQSRHVQTFHLDVKNKEVSVIPAPTCDTGCQAASWDIFDAAEQRDRIASDALIAGGAGGVGEVGGAAESKDTSARIPRSNKQGKGPNGDNDTASSPGAANGSATASRMRGAEEIALTRRVNNSVALSLASPGCLLSLAIDKQRPKSSGSVSGTVRTVGKNNRGGGSHRVSARSSTTSSASIGVGSDASSGHVMNSARGGAANVSACDTVSDEPSTAVAKDGGQVIAEREANAIMSSPQLLESLRTVERTIQQNTYHVKHIKYRAMSALADLAALEASSAVSDAGGTSGDSVHDDIREGGTESSSGEKISETQHSNSTTGGGSDVAIANDPNGNNEVGSGAGSASAAATGSGMDKSGAMADASVGGVSVAGDAVSPDTSSDVVGASAVDDDTSSASVVSGARGASSVGSKRSSNMDLLWKFECPESKGRSVTAMAWNHANPDLLAVAYGNFEFEKNQHGGAILFWTLKNPEFPEEIVYTDSGVCSIDFSKTHPSLLAAGMSNGNVAIYDLRDSGSGGMLARTGSKGSDGKSATDGGGSGGGKGNKGHATGTGLGGGDSGGHEDVGGIGVDDVTADLLAGGAAKGNANNIDAVQKSLQPVLESSKLAAADQHTDAVWQVRWVSRKDTIQGRSNEVLVSISLDGRVAEWSLRKGLTATDLMVLKRANSSARGGLPTGEGIISRTAAGLCFDFPADDSSIYVAGTEDGTIHKCSCSYNEQYLESYYGHAGPVNKVQCSPFAPHIFLSCSADWTMRLWDANKADKEILTFQAVDLSDVVHDVCWSPSVSTLFGSVTGDGRLEVWDLAQSTLDPVITWKRKEQEEKEATDVNAIPSDATVAAAAVASAADDDLDSVAGSGGGGARNKHSHVNNVNGGTGQAKAASKGGSTTTKTQQGGGAGGGGGIKHHYSAIGFARNAPVLVAGDSNGTVDVFRLTGYEPQTFSFDTGSLLKTHSFRQAHLNLNLDEDLESTALAPSVVAQQTTRLLDAICQDKTMA